MGAAGEGRGTALVLLGALGLVGVVVATSRSPVPPPPVPPDAELVVEGDRLSVTQGGVLVVPLLLRNPGQPLEVRRALVYAEPVAQDPVVQAPERVAAGDRRRFVALVAPDCRLLSPRVGLLFQASVLVRVRSDGGSRDLVVDLHADTQVRDRVLSLCAGAAAGGVGSARSPAVDSTTPAPGSQGRAPSRGGYREG